MKERILEIFLPGIPRRTSFGELPETCTGKLPLGCPAIWDPATQEEPRPSICSSLIDS